MSFFSCRKPPGSCCTSKMWTERPFKSSLKPWRCNDAKGCPSVDDELRLYVRSSNSQMVHKWHDKEVPEAWDGSEVDGFWMMVLGRWLRLSQVYDLWLIYAFFARIAFFIHIQMVYFSWCMGQLRTSWNLTKPRAGFFLPTCVGTHYQLPAKALTSLLSPRVPWWFWGLSWHMIPRVNREADKNRSLFVPFLGHCHDIASQYDSGSLVLHRESWHFFLVPCATVQSCRADLTCCGISSFSISFSGMERWNLRFHKAHLLESIGVCPTSSLQQFQLRDLSSFHFGLKL